METTAAAPALPTTLGGRYQVEGRLEGGMTKVYSATDLTSRKSVVLKIAPTSDFEQTSLLVRERESLVRLQHPGIVRCLGLVEDGGWTCLVLEKVPGTNLAEVLEQRDLPITAAVLLDWALQIAEILAYLHEQVPPLIFRDLKPSNLMLAPNGHLTLIDFGASRVRGASLKDTLHLGTPGYAAPEQYAHTEGSSDERSDIYGLGATLYELATRRDPESFRFDFPPLSSLGFAIRSDFEAVLQRAVASDPSKRQASARELLEELRACASPWYRLAPLVGSTAALLVVAGAALQAARQAPGTLAYSVGALGIWSAGLGIGYQAARPQARAATGASSASSGRLLTLVAVAALLPLLLPFPWVYALLTRLSLQQGAAAVALSPPLPAVGLLALLTALTGLAAGYSFQRRAGRIALVALGAFTVLFGGGSLLQGAAHDQHGAPATDASSPLWTLPLPKHRPDTGLQVHPMVDRRSAERYLGVRQEDGSHSVVRARDGVPCWTLPATERQPHATGSGGLLVLQGTQATSRALADGKVQWSQQLPGSVLQACDEGNNSYVGLDSGAVTAIDTTAGNLRWTWKTATLGSDQKPNVYLCHEEKVFLTTSTPPSLTALSATSGAPLWTRPCELDKPFRLMSLPGKVLWISSSQVTRLDPGTGATMYTVDVPSVARATTSVRPLRTVSCGSGRLLVARGQQLSMLDLETGRILWSLPLWDVSADLHPVRAGFACLSLSGDRLQGVDLLNACVTWETWTGGFVQGFLQQSAGPQLVETLGTWVFCQPSPGQSLQAIDTRTGVRAWERAMAQDERVESLQQDNQRLYLVTSRPGAGALLTVLPAPVGMDERP